MQAARNHRHRRDVHTAPFDLGALRCYITNNRVHEAAIELNKVIDTRNNGFHDAQIREIYGSDGRLRNSILFTILRHPATKELLNHPVMRQVENIKWQSFACCMYMQQLMLYLLLLTTLTLAVTMDLSDGESPNFHTQLLVWLNAGVALVLGLAATNFFQYANRKRWAFQSIAAIGLVLFALHFCSDLIAARVNWIWFVRCNNLVLTSTTLYYIRLEILELVSEVNVDANPTVLQLLEVAVEAICDFFLIFVGRNAAHYFSSFFNKVKLPTFVAILVFVVTETFCPFSDDVRLYFGIIVTFASWALGVQYLEIHNTAGYLISLMTFTLNDVVQFMAIYPPFQCAYAIAYYLLFEGRDDVDAYATIAHSFVTTFLVMLGQIDLDPFEDLPGLGQYVLGYTLLLTHATLVIVLFLNVLIAMLNKAMDHVVMEMAMLEARVSFAECIIRSEKTIGLRAMPVVPTDETMPLVRHHIMLEVEAAAAADGDVSDDDVEVDNETQIAAVYAIVREERARNDRLEAMLRTFAQHFNIVVQ
ncbi:hypothetical protein SPRG_08257 [Saprolegnia parasitica CBS 223.65]|uniref:Polycystin cation channel PKD1/PKD2 domain-containing protein n=1 Tax=Saprolegnia parasitica (strain CBS 223.65) TaxID=695850 RepID=A0A067C6P0_SAPPC|nr:hypothetical protein SPRG_08257 [Saprolegnia parasitica CBS 223.65]KDO26454.1 hypothetical protein SPRG_08257 [Saprolegnia parasitica CBS 223.65]|eukprot:XP_012202890.1 hypothetical protein SPRG_08257 [Saprolegnia parasitica CBS 223.65]